VPGTPALLAMLARADADQNIETLGSGLCGLLLRPMDEFRDLTGKADHTVQTSNNLFGHEANGVLAK